jgi:signal transduction histidine kinase
MTTPVPSPSADPQTPETPASEVLPSNPVSLAVADTRDGLAGNAITASPPIAPPETTPDPPPDTGRLARLNAFLDKRVLPYPVKYLTNRVTILGTLTLLIPLILFANITVFVLAANSYLNVMSVVVSSTVLLYSTLSEARDKAVAQRREEIAAQYQKMVEDRATLDHQRIQEMHDHLDQIQALLSSQLVEIENENQQRYNERHTEMLERVAEHSQELDDMRSMIQSLIPTKNDTTSKLG